MVAKADDKFKAKLTNEFIKDEAEDVCNEVKSMFEGTFLQNYEDLLESIEKIVDENRREDAICIARLAEGNEIKEKESKSEGSRYEMKSVYDKETLADVKYELFEREVFQDLSILVVCLMQIILTMLDTLLNVKKLSCPNSRFPSLEMSPNIQEKLLTMHTDTLVKVDLAEDVVVDQTASADKFMFL